MTKNVFRRVDSCRMCGNRNLVPVLDLGEQYLTGVFPPSGEATALTRGPLRLVKCHDGPDACGLLQLEHSYDLSEMYGQNYGYRSGLNATMVRHLHAKVERICGSVDLRPGDVVIDIGSNDGTTLAAYPADLELVGIDPTGDKFRQYYRPHIELIPDFFSAERFTRAYPGRKAKVITSFSMFYDLESPVDFACEIASILDPKEGVWVFEQSYMPLMLERTAYDTVCHEHLEFYGLSQIVWLAAKAGLRVVDVELNDVNGGSFSVVATHVGAHYAGSSDVVQRLLASEKESGLSSLDPYRAFHERTQASRSALQAFVRGVRKKGQRVCGLGASTKGNVVLQYCGFGPDDIESIGDVNPDKFGAVTPGTDIPIQAEQAVLASKPDYLLVLPWHFRDFFAGSAALAGRKLVFPLPQLEIVTPESR